ncbi:Protein of unknown function [Microbacterium sp. cf046]|uniref:DUF2510 domain-containing protein n=1 Tax=Microbacterium sp. cf046 TaxID=1761803 RepID=UPI0008E01D72|nr:DUF2510 domain-containing protein [Microbacterium sp. cf046]SFS02533.1 Protein of unknown function [Microbacterium sp. cf046]
MTTVGSVSLGEMMGDSPPAAPPPGWYADSPSSTRLRWWNGSAWTDHYQGVTGAVPVVPPSDAAPPPATAPSETPQTRAGRRAGNGLNRSDAEPSAPQPADTPPPTRAELRARTAALAAVGAEAAAQAGQPQAAAPPQVTESPQAAVPPAAADAHASSTPAVAVTAPPASVSTASAAELHLTAEPSRPGHGAWPVAPTVTEPFPDQILDRNYRTYDDRPLPPVVYQPQPSGYVSTPKSTFVPVTSQNGPAKSSMVLILISLLGGAVSYWLVNRANPALAGLINLAVMALLLSAFLLAIVGLVLAVRRPTQKRESVFALIVSTLLIAAAIALVMMRLISLGSLYSAG